ncbi:hypothetical protein H6P81_004343 [Aristolochia fimbriata]|uniref:DNA-3-methyladenine glycosylase II n=1 Tax=Aristolochia fimbriata TaxID=158543 RepID=A0AAV7FHF9_ARIFI|nr:hypothetical protein H6P81_004343 [Aristolochia fimbriata]
MPRAPRPRRCKSSITNAPKEREQGPESETAISRSPIRQVPPVPRPLNPLFALPPILSPDFFQVDALDLAPRLLGKLLRREEVILQITEVEAYRPNDTACHGRFGVTARTAPVFGPGGHAYVYLCYGLHTMLNVVADKEGMGAAVLIRSCAPVSGMEIIQQRRGQKTEKPVLLAGPGKISQALGLSTAWSNHPLYTPGGLEILDGPEPEEILVGPRVGIEYASPEDVKALWRFAVAVAIPDQTSKIASSTLSKLSRISFRKFPVQISEAPSDHQEVYFSSAFLSDAFNVDFTPTASLSSTVYLAAGVMRFKIRTSPRRRGSRAHTYSRIMPQLRPIVVRARGRSRSSRAILEWKQSDERDVDLKSTGAGSNCCARTDQPLGVAADNETTSDFSAVPPSEKQVVRFSPAPADHSPRSRTSESGGGG